jgi:membrane associated rhomboid family serine protease
MPRRIRRPGAPLFHCGNLVVNFERSPESTWNDRRRTLRLPVCPIFPWQAVTDGFVAFLRDTSSPQPFLRVPAVVIWLIIVLVAAHALRVVEFPDLKWVAIYGFVPARYSAAYLTANGASAGTVLDQALPFVTYIFLHGSWTHLVINCVWVLPFGPIVARRLGSLLFLVFFLLCGIAGAVAHLTCNWGSPAPVIGASAAIAGLMAAGFRMLPPHRDNSRRPLEPIFSTRIIIWTVLWIVVNVIAGVTGMGTGGEVQLVAWQAHIGGYAAGLFLAGPFDLLARPDVPSRPEA